VLLNNAGLGDKGNSFEGLDKWKTVMDVNLFGYVPLSALHPAVVLLTYPYRVLNVQHTFVPVRYL